MGRKILLVDDEVVLLETIAYNLEQAGYQVVTAVDGASALEAAQREKPDLVILDLMLPEIDGLEVCRQLRREDKSVPRLPIMMLTAKSDEIDVVLGLEVGADDYITKPFGRHELLARVRALFRRAIPPPDPSPPPVDATHDQDLLVVGPIVINRAGRLVTCRNQELELQPKQFDLLVYLARNRGTVLTRDQLLHNVWGYDYAGDTRRLQRLSRSCWHTSRRHRRRCPSRKPSP